MAPLTRNRAAATVPGGLNALYYRQRSSAALIITEASQISRQGMGYPETPGIHTQEQVAGWRETTEAVHDAGGHIFLQLWHVGRISHPSFHDGALPVAPSAIKPHGDTMTYAGLQPFVTPRALTTEEIPSLVAGFRQAAFNAKQAGFDGVEVHAANGYLLDQFLQSGTNQRTDRYGGPVDNRARLLLEVTTAVSEVWGSDHVGVRLSPGGTFNDISDANPVETFGYAAAALSELGLAYLHVIESMPADRPRLDGQSPTELCRRAFKGPLISCGGYNRETAEQALQAGRADLIAFGRAFLANPDLPERLEQNDPLNEPDPATFYGGAEAGYTDYPFLERSNH